MFHFKCKNPKAIVFTSSDNHWTCISFILALIKVQTGGSRYGDVTELQMSLLSLGQASGQVTQAQNWFTSVLQEMAQISRHDLTLKPLQ